MADADNKAEKATDYLGMSDDEILNLTPPVSAPAEDKSEEEELEVDPSGSNSDDTEVEDDGDNEADGESADDAEEEDESTSVSKDEGGEGEEEENLNEEETSSEKPEKSDPLPKGKEKDTKAKATPDGKKDDDPKPDGESGTVNYSEFYNKVMAPFKANGKTIELKSPEEVIQLMQMGANYTKKLQDIQPHRKMLLMLQNNDLLDEGKLSYLIDLDKKNPEAIKKLIKDSNIDPLDIDMDTETTYLEGNHRVSDNEVQFINQIEELKSTQEGNETLVIIDKTWDTASKEMLWENPQAMGLIQQQRINGIYDLITTEIERQRMLGEISPTTPFLQAYKVCGDQLASSGAFDALADKHIQGNANTPTPSVQKERVIVDTRVAKPKSKVDNGDKASAASSTRSTPRKTKEIVNPLALSDDDFLKNFEGRL